METDKVVREIEEEEPTSEQQQTSEEWNEKLDLDEDLLDTSLCDDDGQTTNPNHEFNANIEFLKPEFSLKVGQQFTNIHAFREALVEWHVREGFEIWYVKNEKSRVTAICKRGYNWRIHASPMHDSSTFQIKSIKGQHVCGREYSNVHANSKYLSKKMQHARMDDPNVNVEALSKTIRRTCMLDVSLK